MRAFLNRINSQKALIAVGIVILFSLISSQARFVNAQSGRVTKKVVIKIPEIAQGEKFLVGGNVVFVQFVVSDSEITFVKIRITTDTGDAGGFVVKITPPQTTYSRYVPVFKGTNKIELFAVKGSVSDNAPSASLSARCDNPSCYLALPPTAPEEQGEVVKPETPQPFITIKRPTGDVSDGTVPAVIFVQKKSEIKKVSIAVYDSEENRVDYKPSVDVIDANEIGVVTTQLKMGKGQNTIRVFNPDKRTETTHQAFAVVNCAGTKCGTGSGTETASTETFTIELPTEVSDSSTISPVISVAKASNIKKIKVEVENREVEVANGEKEKRTVEALVTYVDDKAGISTPEIKVLAGKNTIRVSDAENIGNSKSIDFVCKMTKCAKFFDNIAIVQPQDKYKAVNEATISSRIRVLKSSGIKKVLIRALDEKGNAVDDESNKEPVPLKFNDAETTTELPRQIRVVEGKNTITVFDADDVSNSQHRATLEVLCEGDKCGFVDQAGSQNVRMTVGFEQAGASSATSETKPFLDFFFTTPLRFTRIEPVPMLSAWGQIRLSTTPEQTAAAGAFPSNLINQVSQSRETIGLVQSFDYLAGLEWNLFRTNGKYFGLGPTERKAHFYLVAGGGAISPLSSKKETVQIFRVPAANSSQRELFVSRFGETAAAKSYIGFVFPERDRFLRQFYGGLRIKSFDCQDSNCAKYANRFPGVFDLMFGQNEAVTGGRLKNDVTDANGKIIGKKRSYVLRFDAFYPLTFRGAGFNLYGTALLKVGGGGVRITTPLFLDQAPGEILITNPDVFVAPNLQLDRDYYKIGVGFDLMRLFNRQNQ